jgi:drug/metabolite transporter (DMT)-like permease
MGAAPFWLWIPITLCACVAQTARNAAQRSLTGELGGMGATLVRFLYGLPVTALCLILAVAWAGPPTRPFSVTFFAWLPLGALAQILATFLLLDLMRRRNFAVGVAWSKTEIILIAVAGWIFLGDVLSPMAITAVVCATVGVLLLSLKRLRPSDLLSPATLGEAWRGLLSGAGFAASAVAYRASILSVEGPSFLVEAGWTLLWAQALQTVLVLAWLWRTNPLVVGKVFKLWRPSLFAGTMGGLGSFGWFSAFALEPAAHVRTLGLAEMLLSLAVSWRVFKEQASRQELLGQLLVAAAVLLIVNAG